MIFAATACRIRQIIDPLFNWLIEKAGIQKAGMVSYTQGLIVYVFNKPTTVYHICNLTLVSHK